MSSGHQAGELKGDDRILGWTMRIVGIMLCIFSLIFLTQDIFQGSTATYFFAASAGLGIITVITSWMPGAREVQLKQSQLDHGPNTRA